MCATVKATWSSHKWNQDHKLITLMSYCIEGIHAKRSSNKHWVCVLFSTWTQMSALEVLPFLFLCRLSQMKVCIDQILCNEAIGIWIFPGCSILVNMWHLADSMCSHKFSHFPRVLQRENFSPAGDLLRPAPLGSTSSCDTFITTLPFYCHRSSLTEKHLKSHWSW